MATPCGNCEWSLYPAEYSSARQAHGAALIALVLLSTMGGFVLLWHHRHLPYLKVRDIPSSLVVIFIAGTASLIHPLRELLGESRVPCAVTIGFSYLLVGVLAGAHAMRFFRQWWLHREQALLASLVEEADAESDEDLDAPDGVGDEPAAPPVPSGEPALPVPGALRPSSPSNPYNPVGRSKLWRMVDKVLTAACSWLDEKLSPTTSSTGNVLSILLWVLPFAIAFGIRVATDEALQRGHVGCALKQTDLLILLFVGDALLTVLFAMIWWLSRVPDAFGIRPENLTLLLGESILFVVFFAGHMDEGWELTGFNSDVMLAYIVIYAALVTMWRPVLLARRESTVMPNIATKLLEPKRRIGGEASSSAAASAGDTARGLAAALRAWRGATNRVLPLDATAASSGGDGEAGVRGAGVGLSGIARGGAHGPAVGGSSVYPGLTSTIFGVPGGEPVGYADLAPLGGAAAARLKVDLRGGLAVASPVSTSLTSAVNSVVGATAAFPPPRSTMLSGILGHRTRAALGITADLTTNALKSVLLVGAVGSGPSTPGSPESRPSPGSASVASAGATPSAIFNSAIRNPQLLAWHLAYTATGRTFLRPALQREFSVENLLFLVDAAIFAQEVVIATAARHGLAPVAAVEAAATPSDDVSVMSKEGSSARTTPHTASARGTPALAQPSMPGSASTLAIAAAAVVATKRSRRVDFQFTPSLVKRLSSRSGSNTGGWPAGGASRDGTAAHSPAASLLRGGSRSSYGPGRAAGTGIGRGGSELSLGSRGAAHTSESAVTGLDVEGDAADSSRCADGSAVDLLPPGRRMSDFQPTVADYSTVHTAAGGPQVVGASGAATPLAPGNEATKLVPLLPAAVLGAVAPAAVYDESTALPRQSSFTEQKQQSEASMPLQLAPPKALLGHLEGDPGRGSAVYTITSEASSPINGSFFGSLVRIDPPGGGDGPDGAARFTAGSPNGSRPHARGAAALLLNNRYRKAGGLHGRAVPSLVLPSSRARAAGAGNAAPTDAAAGATILALARGIADRYLGDDAPVPVNVSYHGRLAVLSRLRALESALATLWGPNATVPVKDKGDPTERIAAAVADADLLDVFAPAEREIFALVAASSVPRLCKDAGLMEAWRAAVRSAADASTDTLQ